MPLKNLIQGYSAVWLKKYTCTKCNKVKAYSVLNISIANNSSWMILKFKCDMEGIQEKQRKTRQGGRSLNYGKMISWVENRETALRLGTHSLKDMWPSLFVSKSIKNFDGAHSSSPGFLSPLRYPSLTRCDSDGGNTGTTALIRSAGVINISPSWASKDAKYSKTFKETRKCWNKKLTMDPHVNHRLDRTSFKREIKLRSLQ